MERVSKLAAALVTVLGAAAQGASVDRPTSAYEISARAAVTILPADLQQFFERNVEAFCQWAIGADGPDSPTVGTRPERHYVKLDVAAASTDTDKRREAARSFPHDPTLARDLFRKHGEARGGTLPWAVQEGYADLVRAFRRLQDAGHRADVYLWGFFQSRSRARRGRKL